MMMTIFPWQWSLTDCLQELVIVFKFTEATSVVMLTVLAPWRLNRLGRMNPDRWLSVPCTHRCALIPRIGSWEPARVQIEKEKRKRPLTIHARISLVTYSGRWAHPVSFCMYFFNTKSGTRFLPAFMCILRNQICIYKQLTMPVPDHWLNPFINQTGKFVNFY